MWMWYIAWYMLAVFVCLSVCPSVRPSVSQRRRCTKTAKRRITQTTQYDSAGILAFLIYVKYLDEIPMGLPHTGGGEIEVRRFLTNISLFISNGARQGHSYNGTQLRTHMRSVECRYFQWPWVTITTPNHPIFDIFYRLSYLPSGWC